MASRRSRDDDFGLKKSSGVNYAQVADRHVDDERFERQRAARSAPAAPAAEKPKAAAGMVAAPQSATMDAFMRMMTGKEERTIADRISDPNRPTWEQYKRDNADKLDLDDSGEKEMREYRRKLDAEREKRLSGGSKKTKKKKRRRSEASSEDSESEDERRRSRRKSRKSKKRHKRDASDSSDASDSDAARRKKKEKKEKKRKSRKSKKAARGGHSSRDRSGSASPVRLSSFFQQHSDSDAA